VKFTGVTGSVKTVKTDLVFLAMGFTGVDPSSQLARELALEVSPQGKLAGAADRGIFTIGDTRTGQSLVVRAMADALQAANDARQYLAR
jgi:glutamate synthase (NADPH/NADH) small chain